MAGQGPEATDAAEVLDMIRLGHTAAVLPRSLARPKRTTSYAHDTHPARAENGEPINWAWLGPPSMAFKPYAAVPGPASRGSPFGRVSPSSRGRRRAGSVWSSS